MQIPLKDDILAIFFPKTNLYGTKYIGNLLRYICVTESIEFAGIKKLKIKKKNWFIFQLYFKMIVLVKN